MQQGRALVFDLIDEALEVRTGQDDPRPDYLDFALALVHRRVSRKPKVNWDSCRIWVAACSNSEGSRRYLDGHDEADQALRATVRIGKDVRVLMEKDDGPSVTATRRFARTATELIPGVGHRALLFDWDGTLADSQALNYAVLAHALRQQRIGLDRAWFDARTGVSTTEMVQQVGALHGRELDVDRAAQDRDRSYLERLAEVSEVAAVVDVLRREHGRRICALATGGGRATVLSTAERLGLLELFDTVVTRQDVERGKPEPDIFLLAATRLGVPPRQCLVYEDSDEGLEAADAAGMDSVDVRPLRGPVSSAAVGPVRTTERGRPR